MGWCGLELDRDRNESASGESLVSSESSRVAVWTLPTNEELVVARQAVEALANGD
jgi:acetate kinase